MRGVCVIPLGFDGVLVSDVACSPQFASRQEASGVIGLRADLHCSSLINPAGRC